MSNCDNISQRHGKILEKLKLKGIKLIFVTFMMLKLLQTLTNLMTYIKIVSDSSELIHH